MTFLEQKSELRQRIREMRSALSVDEQRELSSRIVNRLLPLLQEMLQAAGRAGCASQAGHAPMGPASRKELASATSADHAPVSRTEPGSALRGESLSAEQEESLTAPHNVPAVMSYMPFRSEVDVTPVMEWCWQQGIPVVLPRVLPGSKQLQLHEVRAYEELTESPWGIREPSPSLPVWDELASIRALLIPGVAFDLHMGRLGYGGGYYDRFLQQVYAAKKSELIVVAPAYELQIVKQTPIETHDFRVDLIVTENRTIQNSSSFRTD